MIDHHKPDLHEMCRVPISIFDNFNKGDKIMIIDGIEYVPRINVSEDMVIVRTYSAGVFFGKIEKRDGKEVQLSNARRLWYWSGAASLSQMALDGVANPDKCKFPEAVPFIILTEVIEIINCTEKAVASINKVKTWKI